MASFLQKLWPGDDGQDVAEYALMLAVILALAVGTVKAIGGNATTVFSSVGSAIQ
jgi:Flp pilus assembly pilin Flp